MRKITHTGDTESLLRCADSSTNTKQNCIIGTKVTIFPSDKVTKILVTKLVSFQVFQFSSFQVSKLLSFHVSKLPRFQVSMFPCFHVSKFPSFQGSKLKQTIPSKTGWRKKNLNFLIQQHNNTKHTDIVTQILIQLKCHNWKINHIFIMCG